MEKTIPQSLEEIKNLEKQTHQLIQKLTDIQEKKEHLRPTFLESSETKRTFRKKVEEIFKPYLPREHPPYGLPPMGDLEVGIMGYFDQALLPMLEGIMKSISLKTKIRIISPELNKDKRDRVSAEALNQIKKMGGEVKYILQLHSRLLYVKRGDYCEVIIGSGDLNSDCLDGRRFDASIWSDHPKIAEDAIDFFNRVWSLPDSKSQ